MRNYEIQKTHVSQKEIYISHHHHTIKIKTIISAHLECVFFVVNSELAVCVFKLGKVLLHGPDLFFFCICLIRSENKRMSVRAR